VVQRSKEGEEGGGGSAEERGAETRWRGSVDSGCNFQLTKKYLL